MPRSAPFTQLCQVIAAAHGPLADLHTHTTHSDGTQTPAEIVAAAISAKLCAVAVTDHDTTAGVTEARLAANGRLEVVTGIELTAEIADREIHILGYWLAPDHPELIAALERLRLGRLQRFWNMAERLRQSGAMLDEAELQSQVAGVSAPGRRHLAAYLARTGQTQSVQSAFHRWLADSGEVNLPKLRLPAAEAIRLIRLAGGLASWAHPPSDLLKHLADLAAVGLQAVEVEYPGRKLNDRLHLRSLATEFGLAISGGSDSHGAKPARRAVGSCGIRISEYQRLRGRLGDTLCR